MKTEDRKYLTVRQASERYGLAKSTLDKLRMRGKGCPYSKIGSRVLYAVSDLDKWLEDNRRG